MKTVTLVVCYFISICIAGCEHTSAVPEEWKKSEKVVNNLLNQSVVELQQKYPLCLFGDSVGIPGGKLNYLGLEFKIIGPLSKDQLRKILVDSAETLLANANQDSELRPYIPHYPLTLDNIGITLFVIDSKGIDLENPHIGTASISKGLIRYRIWTKDKEQISRIKIEDEESYEEALKILQKSKPDSPTHQVSNHEKRASYYYSLTFSPYCPLV